VLLTNTGIRVVPLPLATNGSEGMKEVMAGAAVAQACARQLSGPSASSPGKPPLRWCASSATSTPESPWPEAVRQQYKPEALKVAEFLVKHVHLQASLLPCQIPQVPRDLGLNDRELAAHAAQLIWSGR